MQHSRHPTVYLPGVAVVSRGMALEVEKQDLTLPNRLALEFLHNMDPIYELGLGAVGLADGVLELGDRQDIHSILFYAIRKLDAWKCSIK